MILMYDESYWHISPKLESNSRYEDVVYRQLQTELEMLKMAKSDLDFEYELGLSRALRKMRRKLAYGRYDSLWEF